MKMRHSALCALLLVAAAGNALAQTPANCPPLPGAAGAPQVGNNSNRDKVANADSDLPKDSPLAGLPNPYTQQYDWAKMPKGRLYGDDRAIAIDKDGKSVWVVDRCDLSEQGCVKPQNKSVNPIMKFDTNGNLVKSFGAGMLYAPHGARVDKNGNLWTADGGPNNIPAGCPRPATEGNLLREWSPDGKVLMTIRGPVDGKPFTGLNDVDFGPNGEIYVADGHARKANMRILKFDKTGKFLLAWGSQGAGDDQIGIPHGLAVDKQNRVYVADRTDQALKVYDGNSGKLLHVWKQFGTPSGVFIDKHDMLYVSDEIANSPKNPKFSPGVRIARLSDGKVLMNVPYRPGNNLEGITVDDAGNIYGANTNHPRAVRWMKKS
jgi:DNA-binding beta-propeller fold protein YncE